MPNFLDIEHNRIKLLIILLLIIMTIAAYWQLTECDFISFDDNLYVTENRQVQSGITIEGIIWAFTTFHAGNWHPLTWLSHMVDCQLYGLNPMGHHWTNLLFHMANTLLIFFIFQKITEAIWKSAFVATLFALHPLHVESVAWVAERKDVLSTFFGLLMIVAYYHYVNKPSITKYIFIILFLSLGLMAKPMLVTMPFVLLLLDLWPLKRLNLSLNQPPGQTSNLIPLIQEKIPLFILATISISLTFLAQQSSGAVQSLELIPINYRIANALIAYSGYFIKAIWPQYLSVFYPHLGINQPVWKVVSSTLFLIGTCFGAIRASKKYPYMLVGLLWYIITLLPVIGLIQVGAQSMADRYTYIPLTGLFVIFTWGMHDLLSKNEKYLNSILSLSAVIIISALSLISFNQVKHWKNSTALFENAINVTDDNWLAHNNLGAELYNKEKLDESVFHFQKALKIKPLYFSALYNLGKAYHKKDKLDKATFYYNNALKIKPEHEDTHNNLANLLFAQGRLDEAATRYNLILKINSDNADVHNNLGYLLITQEKHKEALLHFNEALRINPEHADAHYNLGLLMIEQGKIETATTHLVKALTMLHFKDAQKINPGYAKVYNKIGIILYKNGKLKEAGIFFSKAIQINPDYLEAVENLEMLKNNQAN